MIYLVLGHCDEQTLAAKASYLWSSLARAGMLPPSFSRKAMGVDGSTPKELCNLKKRAAGACCLFVVFVLYPAACGPEGHGSGCPKAVNSG